MAPLKQAIDTEVKRRVVSAAMLLIPYAFSRVVYSDSPIVCIKCKVREAARFDFPQCYQTSGSSRPFYAVMPYLLHASPNGTTA